MATEYPLSLIIKAVDKATAPLREINAKIQKFTAPVRKLNNAFRALSDEAGLPKLAKGFSGVGRAVSSVGHEALALGAKIGALAAGAGFALYRIVKGATDAGDELATMSQRVGLSVDAYAQLQYAAAQADVEQEQFSASMDQFNKRLGEAKAGGGPLLAFLQKVAPALALQVKGAKGTEAALMLMAGAFEKVKDPGKRAALAAAAFGKSGLQMGQFLGQGEKGVRAFMAHFFELVGSQEEFARGASALDNAARDTEKAFEGMRAAALGELFPALTQLTKGVTDFLVANRDGITKWAQEAGAAISSWVAGGGLKSLADSLRDIAGAAKTVVGMLGGLKGVAAILGVYLASGFIGSVAGAAGALWNLGAAIVPMVIRGVMLAIPAFWSLVSALMAVNLANPLTWVVALGAALAGAALLIYKHWGPIKEFFVGLWAKVKPILSWISEKMSLTPFGLAAKGALWAGNKMFGAEDARPSLGASAAVAGAPGTQTSAAHVTVDFGNLPKGARVTADPKSTANLDLGLGYSMAD